MRGRALLAAAVLLLAGGGVAASAASDPFVSAIVRVRSIVTPRLLFAPDRQTRAASVEMVLRGELHTRGRLVAAALAAGTRRGVVRSVRVLWIDGSYGVVARASFLAQLRRRGDVASVTSARSLVRPEGFDWITLDAFPSVWNDPTTPSDGTGTTVAVIDSGIDLSGPLAARYRGRAHDWFDATATSDTPVDTYSPHGCDGHGTGVASVIADGAPGAKLIAANIFDASCSSDVIGTTAALQWALDPDGDPRTPDAPDVLNASWGAETACDPTYEAALGALRGAGILPVFPSGNNGTPDSPASLPEAIAVGGLETDTAVASFSGRGDVSACRGAGVFPDIAAPAVGLTVLHRFEILTPPVSGTSFSTPQVAAALAVMLQRHPGMTADEQAAALRATAAPIADPAAGSGRLDVAALLASSLPAPRDTTAPILLGLPTIVATRDDAAFTIPVTATDDVPLAHVVSAVASVETTFQATTFTTPGTSATVDVPQGLAEGTYPLVAHATDTIGNVGVADTVQVIVDRTAPVLSGGSVDASHVIASAAETGSGVVSVSLAIDGGPPVSEPGSGPTVVVAYDAGALADGPHTARLVATDAAGNASAPLDVPFLLDRVAPLVTDVRAPLDRAGLAHLVAHVGDALLAEWYEGTGPHHALATVAGAISTGIATAGWTPGTHRLLVRARDAAGNWSVPVAVDVIVPARLAVRHATLTVRLGGRATYVEEGAPTIAGILEVSFLLNADGARLRGVVTVLQVRDRRGHVLLHVDVARIGGRTVIRTVRASVAGRWTTLGHGARLVDVSLKAAGVASVRLGTTSRSAPSHGTLRFSDYRSWVWLPAGPG